MSEQTSHQEGPNGLHEPSVRAVVGGKPEMAGLHRAMPSDVPVAGDAFRLPFLPNGDVLIYQDQTGARLLRDSDSMPALSTSTQVYLGALDGHPCFAADLPSEAMVPGVAVAVDLRLLYGMVSDAEFGAASYATQILYWLRTSRFCPVCGSPTEARMDDWGRRCVQCGHTSYPRVSPAVLILIHDGDRILLASKPGWGKRRSILAGFVEPSETLEECAIRETMEEVGITIADLVYVGSQPWSFPHQLMVGFTARYVSGEIHIDGRELAEAAWYTQDALPSLPPLVSLARKMIDRWSSRYECGHIHFLAKGS